MRVKLLHDSQYGDMENVKFPIEVEATDWLGLGVDVSGAELIGVGADPEQWDANRYYFWPDEDISK